MLLPEEVNFAAGRPAVKYECDKLQSLQLYSEKLEGERGAARHAHGVCLFPGLGSCGGCI